MTPSEASAYARARSLDDAEMDLWRERIHLAIDGRCIALSVDVGCGTGRFANVIRNATSGRVIGIDLSAAMLAEGLRWIGDGVLLLCGDGASLPLQSGQADLMFYSMVLHHFKDCGSALRESFRCLRAGGTICIRTSTADRLDAFTYLRYFPTARQLDEGRLMTGEGIHAALCAAGFRIVSHDVVVQQAEKSPRDYVRMVRERALSDLLAIADAEFEEGVGRLAGDVDAGMPICLDEPMDFVVARKR